MGWGVPDGATFEALVENTLNRENSGANFRGFEILNLGVPGYFPPQQMVAVERALRFRPQAIWYVATGREMRRASDYLAEVVRSGIDIPYEDLRRIVSNAGVQRSMDEATALKRLTPHRADVLASVYRYIVQQTRAHDAIPVLIFLPQVREGAWQEETAETLQIAEAAGFRVIDLEDVYRGHDITAIRLAEWDDHPNVRGHQLIAEQLLERIRPSYDELFPAARGDRASR
jgi:hypothetical protein